jgi:acyl-CoA synthetase (AMP-forming)/AMP-acid ligase II
VFSAGAPLPERTAERLVERTGLVIRPLYGTTETGGITVARDGAGQVAAGAVGSALEGVELRLGAPEDTGSDAPIGRLWVRSSSMMAGYLAGDGVDGSMVVDGWFDSGDLASIADDGTVTLFGRSSDLINVSGLKVLPSEVEEAIRLLPGVADVAVYGGQDRRGMTLVKTAVVASGVSEGELRAHCRRNLAGYKCPTVIAFVDALPKTPSGKVVRNRLP